MEEVLEDEDAEPENCYARKCSSNADCCSSHACVDVDGGKNGISRLKVIGFNFIFSPRYLLTYIWGEAGGGLSS